MDDAHRVLPSADVLVVGDRIAEVGPDLDGARRHRGDRRPGRHRDARHDRHPPAHVADRDARLRRGLDADPVLRLVLPGVRQALPAGRTCTPATCSPPSEAIDAGVTTCVDWSHGLQTADHAEAAVDALRSVPGRFVLAYGNIQQAPWEWSAAPEFRSFARRHIDAADDMLGFQMAFDVTGDPAFPEQAAYEVARELGCAGHHPRRRLGRHERRRHPAGARGRVPRRVAHLRARRDADRRLLPPDRGHRRLDLGVDRERAERRAGLPADLGRCAHTASRSRCRWTPASGGAATCSPRCAPRSAPTARASTWRRTPRATRSPTARLRAEQVVDWATRGGARALGRDSDLGSLELGKKADVVLIKNEQSPVLVPAAQPVRARRVPGPARRRAHRAGRRQGGQARPPAGRRRPRPRSAGRSRSPSTTCAPRSARRPGTRG